MKSPKSMSGRTAVCRKCGYMNVIPESPWRRFSRLDDETRLTLKAVIGLAAIAAIVTAAWLLVRTRSADLDLEKKNEALQAEKAALASENDELRVEQEKLAARFKDDETHIAELKAWQARFHAQLNDLQASRAKASEPAVQPPTPPPVVVRPAPATASASRAKAPPKNAGETIAEAVGRGVAYLKNIQNEDGSFGGPYRSSYPNGETALALLALRYAGVSVSDPAYARGSANLLAGTSDKTYVNSLAAQVLALIPADARSPAARVRMTQLARFLTTTQCETGMWSYGPLQRAVNGRTMLINPLGGDNSNTQFAVLGLWKLAEAGAEVDRRALRACESHWLETQHADGGWDYCSRAPRPTGGGGVRTVLTGPSTPAMTAAGLATLNIFADLLHLNDEGTFAAGHAPNCGRSGPYEQQMDAAQARTEADLAAFLAAGRGRGLGMNTEYYLYSVERVGAASGQKYFGGLDWYASAARLFLAAQNRDGSWGDTVNTSLAILFLAKGQSPVFFEKLRYDGDWCNDRRDVAHITDYAGRELEQPFNWEVIDVKSDVGGWFDGPVLFFNGHDGPNFSDDEKQKLKDYVVRGGMLFAEACCGRPKFAAAARKLGEELWPELEWKKLPADHPLFTHQSHFDLKTHPALEGLTDAKGFTFFILSPQDVSCIWNQNLRTGHEDDFLLALNVYRYAKRGEPMRSH
jgi:cell division protein FtsB